MTKFKQRMINYIYFVGYSSEGRILKLLIISILTLLLFNCQPRSKVDYSVLTIELDSIMKEDQKFRSELSSFSFQSQQDSIKWKNMIEAQNKIDSSNLERILEIIEDVGSYPGKTMVGESASKVTFFVLQHSSPEIQKEHLNLILEAAEKLELNKIYAAMFQDRVLMYKGKPQIYGTQIRRESIFDSLSGEQSMKSYLWPIKDTTNLDSLRLWNGLIPLEDYLDQMGAEFQK